ncbi:outer membrane protein assembly factor BamB family protein [Halosimplex sp. J119]
MGDSSGAPPEVTGRFSVRAAGRELRTPKAIRLSARLDDGLVLSLNPETDSPDRGDFAIGSDSQPLVAVSPDGTVVWVADAEDGLADAVHEEVHVQGGRVITRTDTDQYVEFDPETGSVVRSWSNEAFVIDGHHHRFDRAIESFRFSEGTWVLQTDRGLYWFDSSGRRLAEWSLDELSRPDRWDDLFPGVYQLHGGKTLLAIQEDQRGSGGISVLYGFDETGEQHWRRQFRRRWVFHPEEDRQCCVSTHLRRNTYATVKVDIETGEFVRAVRGPEDAVQRFLDT